jgi:phosphoglycolate phosphatase
MPTFLITFDLDGTLIDTADEIAEAANLTLDECGIPRQAPEAITRLIGAGTRELMIRLLTQIVDSKQSLGEHDTEGVIRKFETHYSATVGTSARPYPGCEATLSQIKAKGGTLVCLTNKEERFARKVLANTKLDHFFDLIVGGDTLTMKKPDPGTLKHVQSVIGLPLIAHVGDSGVDVATAHNAGVPAWAVTFGYNAGRPVVLEKPTLLFDDLISIARHVEAMNL